MDALDRLYRRIADVLLREPGTAVTVGDIYQHLVPYRTVRSELGFGELAEYEHALLRLLSGERDYLVVERAEVQEEFQRELRTTNPILGVYRDYSDVGVYMNPYAPEPPVPDLTAPPPPAAASARARRSAEGDADEPGMVLDFTSPEPAAAPAAPPQRPRPKACTGCRSTLPPGRDVRFCPFCGKCLAPIPCPECSSTVEPEWRFCIACGWPRDGQPLPPAPEQRLR
ncbi:MAG TPA: zinc ribbon domain-containing protein [Acetobacteraceae bacterium]|nr:zinc ribbon domain-containing protein [Acetobacteraceae bacterium]